MGNDSPGADEDPRIVVVDINSSGGMSEIFQGIFIGIVMYCVWSVKERILELNFLTSSVTHREGKLEESPSGGETHKGSCGQFELRHLTGYIQ